MTLLMVPIFASAFGSYVDLMRDSTNGLRESGEDLIRAQKLTKEGLDRMKNFCEEVHERTPSSSGQPSRCSREDYLAFVLVREGGTFGGLQGLLDLGDDVIELG